MNATWYRTGGWKQLIEPVEVVKVTEKSVTIVEQRWTLDGGVGEPAKVRHPKQSASYSFFQTWDEAHTHLLDKAERAVNSARVRLNDANGRLGNIKGLKKPEATK